MKKKFLSTGLALVMVASMLVGCGGSGSDSGSTTSAPSDTQATEAPAADKEEATEAKDEGSSDSNTLSVAAWDLNFNIPALKAAEKDYQENVDPNFKLEIREQSQAADIEDAITLAGSSGDYSNLPDIVLFQDHWFQRFQHDYPDAFIDANDADVNWEDFGQEKLSYSTVNNIHYGFPVDNGTAIFAYRTDILKECGYTIDDVTGITWDRWIDIGEDVYNKTGKYLLSMDGDGNDLIYMMLQAEGSSQFKDGKPYITENETCVKVCEKIVEMCQRKACYLANDWGDYTDQTIIGDMVAGVMNGNWIIPTIEQVKENEGKWKITTMPTLGGGEGYASNGGSSLYITGNCKNADLAKKFLAYTFGGSTVTYDAALQDGGVITCCISAGKSEVYNKGVPYFENDPIYTKIVEMGSHVPVVEQSDYHYKCRTQMAAAIINAVQGSDLKTELKTAEDNLKFAMESE
ncbi:MAG: extracellular solute-binding protein [Eubacterium sp.]|nr:extracellular solute-binding protein [Eubacterium sp.]